MAIIEAVAAAEGHGLRLETTYTGKCLAALRRDLADPRRRPAGPVLFWTTHGDNDLREHVEPAWTQRLPATLRRRVEASAPVR